MASLVLNGNTSGSVTISSPAVSGTTTLTLPVQTGTVMVNGPAFKASSSGTQTISNGTWTKVTLGTVAFDTNSNFSSSRFTPTVAGYYQINASVRYNTALGANYIETAIYKNGSVYSSVYGFFVTNGYGGAALSDVVYLNGSTDYVELYTIQAQGSSQTTQAGCLLSGALIRGA
jgi:hypothetical protein